MSQNAVMNVPAMLPAVETANSRPAVLPTLTTDRARRRTAIGVAVARITLGSPKSRTAASSGSSRGPGSRSTIASSTGSSTTRTRSVAAAPSASTTSRSCGAGNRSANAACPITNRQPGKDDADEGAQTKIEFPKNGARTRLAASSTPRSTPPDTNTAAPIARPERRSASRKRRATTSSAPQAETNDGAAAARGNSADGSVAARAPRANRDPASDSCQTTPRERCHARSKSSHQRPRLATRFTLVPMRRTARLRLPRQDGRAGARTP